ncbi:adenylyl-sulfate kinase [Pseudomonas sp. B20]|uniref:adenylyl-sulfate kinase n=1 Tax=Pseudomonas sp. B20 TaxID=129268 RepID=UPI001CFB7A80|nr:adenylyl-sulfate kinase [Pseudomonas sp. B20]
MIDKSITNPGIHKQFIMANYSEDERKILLHLSKDWYLTNSGQEVRVAQSRYSYFLMKPSQRTSEMFNIEREIICVFSDYEYFEPRSFDIFDKVLKSLPKMRTETVCGLLISRASVVEEKVERLLKSDPEHSIVIPATYQELLHNDCIKILENKFRKHFYSRDLFGFLSPLKKDIYFFGRSSLITELISRYQSGEHTSLFGLRKSGKTSIVYAIERKLESLGEHALLLDCESPSIHLCRWNELLEKLVNLYAKVKQTRIKVDTKDRYAEKDAADSFETDIMRIFESKKPSSMLFIFDEIERISPGTGSSDHWRSGTDFLYFWQTLRGFYQKNPQVFCYMLVGTNPSCVESSSVVGHDNPIYASIPSQYVPSFSVEQVKQMVVRLGDYMGLKFDDLIAAKLTDDFGGHPFLIRQMCSCIHKMAGINRPVTIDKVIYNKAKEEFKLHSKDYLDMMLQVLSDWYPDEYEMLRFLAQGDRESFESFAFENASLTRHLIGYGLIQKGASGYAFNLEAIADLLKTKHSNEKINLTNEEMVQEVSARRNLLEKNLRTLSRNVLKITYGPAKAATAVLAAVPETRRPALTGLNINLLLDRDKSPLFLLELINIIKREWAIFDKSLEADKTKLMYMLEEINLFGRPEAHAKNLTRDEFTQLRLHFNKLDALLAE